MLRTTLRIALQSSHSFVTFTERKLPSHVLGFRPFTTKLDSTSSPTLSEGEESPAKPKIRIYTRTGDGGTTALFTGERRSKDDEVFEALGTTDELSSALGLASAHCEESGNGLSARFEEIQCILQDVGSALATPVSSASGTKLARVAFDGTAAARVEGWIDDLDKDLPPLRAFILPSGGKSSAAIHVARTVCRRAERRIVPLVRDGHVDPSVGRFVNRLSDYLFTAARYAAMKDGKAEAIYRRQHPPQSN